MQEQPDEAPCSRLSERERLAPTWERPRRLVMRWRSGMVAPNQDSGGTRRACGSRNTDGVVRHTVSSHGHRSGGIRGGSGDQGGYKGRKPVTGAGGRGRATELHAAIVADDWPREDDGMLRMGGVY